MHPSVGGYLTRELCGVPSHRIKPGQQELGGEVGGASPGLKFGMCLDVGRQELDLLAGMWDLTRDTGREEVSKGRLGQVPLPAACCARPASGTAGLWLPQNPQQLPSSPHHFLEGCRDQSRCLYSGLVSLFWGVWDWNWGNCPDQGVSSIPHIPSS